VALDSFNLLLRRLHPTDAITVDGNISAADMPAWHARNFLLLSTSLHESFGYAVLKLLLIARPGAELDVRVVVNMAGSPAAGLRAFETLTNASSGFLNFRPKLAGIIRRDDRVRDAIRRQSLLLARTPQSIAGHDVEQIALKLREGAGAKCFTCGKHLAILCLLNPRKNDWLALQVSTST
jgi:MinD-like ATPase involved in chromosome partitioning or flagellar assembly